MQSKIGWGRSVSSVILTALSVACSGSTAAQPNGTAAAGRASNGGADIGGADIGGSGTGTATNGAGRASVGGGSDAGTAGTAGDGIGGEAASGAGTAGGSVGPSVGGQAGGFGARQCEPSTSASGVPTLGLEPQSDLFDDVGTLNGTVTAVAADRLDFLVGGQASWLLWVGASLEPAFAIGDAVQISIQYVDPIGLSPPTTTIVRSASATAVTIVASTYRGLETSVDSTAHMPTLSGMPTLDYSIRCCSPRSNGFACDYSSLSAGFNGTSSPIAHGQTGTLGPWSVANINSWYYQGVEDIWNVGVTMLGPATVAADGTE